MEPGTAYLQIKAEGVDQRKLIIRLCAECAVAIRAEQVVINSERQIRLIVTKR